jgi:hypothetical protein
LNQGETVEYIVELTSTDDLKFELNWGGSELKLSVYKPNGDLYDEKSTSSPPLSIAVDDAEKGDWTYKVKGESVDTDHYPYALMVGSKSMSSGQTDPSGGELLPMWMLLAIIAIIAVVIIVVAVVAVRKRKKPPTTPQHQQQPGYQQSYQQPYQQQYQQPGYQQPPPPQGPPPQSPPPPPPPPPPP